MKKIIAVILVAVFAVLTLAACNNNTKKPDASTPSGTKQPSTPASSTPTASDSNPESTPDSTPDNTTFDTRDETVYVFNTDGGLKLRTTNNFNIDNVAKIVENGTQLKRVGVGIEDPAVSKVVFEGNEYYCGSKYLTTEVPAETTGGEEDEAVDFETKDETVKVIPDQATVYTMAYKGWSTTNRKHLANDIVLTKDTEVKVTGVCYEDENDYEVGWARIEYEGKTYYVRLSVLALAAPENVTSPETTPAATPAETPAASTAA